MAHTFQATVGGKFAPLIGHMDEDMDINTIITIYNTAVIDSASEIPGYERHRKKKHRSQEMFLTFVVREVKKRYKLEEQKYREVNKRIQKVAKEAKYDWIGTRCEDVETCLKQKTTARKRTRCSKI